MPLNKRTWILVTLLLAPLSVASATAQNKQLTELEISNKTSFPLYVFQGKLRSVVLPDARFQSSDYKSAPLTISTSTPDAAIKFVTLTNDKGCQAQTCVLITGN